MRLLLTLFFSLTLNSQFALADNLEQFRNTTWVYSEDGEKISLEFNKTGTTLNLPGGFQAVFDSLSFIEATGDTPALIRLESDYYGIMEFAIDNDRNCLQGYGEGAPDFCLTKVESDPDDSLFEISLNEFGAIIYLLENIESMEKNDNEDVFGTPGTIKSIVRNDENNFIIKAGTRELKISVLFNQLDSDLFNEESLSYSIVKLTGKKSNNSVFYYRSITELNELTKLLKNESEKVTKKLGSTKSITAIVRTEAGNYEVTAGKLVLTINRVSEPTPPGFAGKKKFKLIVGDVRPLKGT